MKDKYLTVKQYIKPAIAQILSSQEFTDYHHYSVILKTPLIGRDNVKVKNLPIVRPSQALLQKINDILATTIPVALLADQSVITYFETYRNYKMDFIDSQFMITKLSFVEKELEAYLNAVGND